MKAKLTDTNDIDCWLWANKNHEGQPWQDMLDNINPVMLGYAIVKIAALAAEDNENA